MDPELIEQSHKQAQEEVFNEMMDILGDTANLQIDGKQTIAQSLREALKAAELLVKK